MTLNNVFDHYRLHLSRMVKRSTREDYNKRLAMLSKFCAMHNATTIEDIDFTQFLEWVFISFHSSYVVVHVLIQAQRFRASALLLLIVIYLIPINAI